MKANIKKQHPSQLSSTMKFLPQSYGEVTTTFHDDFTGGVEVWVSSAVCLLELCGLETEKLRVDVEAAKRWERVLSRGSTGSSMGGVFSEIFMLVIYQWSLMYVT